MILSLSGFMGCGKSTVGRELASRLACSFLDLDEAVEVREGRSIPEIFAAGGEAAFRKAEAEALKALLPGPSGEKAVTLVLALGGGTLTTAACRARIRRCATNLYLRAGVDTLVGNLSEGRESRPMLQGGDLRGRISQLMERRAPLYEAAADITLDIDGLTTGEIVSRILKAIAG